MTTPTISAVGAYAPRFRITAEEFADAWGRFQASGIRETAVPAADEDTLTMAYEAAIRALESADVSRGDVEWLGFATTTPPLEEEDLTARLAAMLGVPGEANTQAFTSSTRAGTRAIWGAMDALEGEPATALVVTADAPQGALEDEIDHAAGAGAAAFVLECDRSGPARLVDRATYSAPYPGTRFRERGEEATTGLGITGYDRRAFLETVEGAVDGLESTGNPDAAAIQAPNGKLPYRAAGAAGVDTDVIQRCATVHDLGDLGAASVPVTLARALVDVGGGGMDESDSTAENESTTILAVSHGSGAGGDALVLEVDGVVSARLSLEGDDPISYSEYLRRRGAITDGPPAGGGAYVSLPTWRRSLSQRYRLEAGRCLACESLAFPPEGACPTCGDLEGYETLELPGTGTVEAVTRISQGGAPPEFSPLQARSGTYAALIVSLEAGDRRAEDDGLEMAVEGDGDTETVSVPAMGTGAAPGTFEVGDRVESTIRRLYTQEGVTRYAFKFRPR